MKNKPIKLVVMLLLYLSVLQSGRSQGFINLAFEHPVLPLNPVNGLVPASNAIPGWTAYAYGSPIGQVFYNDVSIGAAAVSLQGPGSLLPVIQGNYTVYLQGSTGGMLGSAAIGQTGQIPTNAQSLTFWGQVVPNGVSIGGQTLDLIQTGSTPNYNIYAADITAFAGQSDQLLFTAPVGSEAFIDNIVFSPNPAPEPNTLGLLCIGSLSFGLYRWRRK
jgi:hypothetical protein